MSYTNSTPNYNLPQWIGTDKPTFLGDFNGAFSAIDTAIKNASDSATSAASTANAASATANSANTNANTALSTANNAKDTADAATSAAAAATSAANTATSTANNAAHAALGNNIANLAPAYDPTLTYNVGDLVTYIDENNSGKLYKCIIAVNTPMSFNVNYWDDVTTSEIYGRKPVKVGEVVSDGVKTYAEILTELAAYAEHINSGNAYNTFIRSETGNDIGIYRLFIASATEYRFSVAQATSTGAVVERIVLSDTTPSGGRYTTTFITSGGVNVTNNDSTVPTAGYKYELFV